MRLGRGPPPFLLVGSQNRQKSTVSAGIPIMKAMPIA